MNDTRMLQAVWNKFSLQHPLKQRLYDHLPSITQTIQDMLGTAVDVRTNT